MKFSWTSRNSFYVIQLIKPMHVSGGAPSGNGATMARVVLCWDQKYRRLRRQCGYFVVSTDRQVPSVIICLWNRHQSFTREFNPAHRRRDATQATWYVSTDILAVEAHLGLLVLCAQLKLNYEPKLFNLECSETLVTNFNPSTYCIYQFILSQTHKWKLRVV